MNTKKPEVTEATRRRILDAFWELFKDMSVEKITAAMIADAAGIHRSSFYRYFTDIYQVLDAFQEEMLSYIEEEVSAIWVNTSITLPEYAERVSSILLGYSDRLYRLLNYKGCTFREKFTGEVRPNLEQMISVDAPPQNREYMIEFIISTMLFNFNFWYEHREHVELRQVNAYGQKILLNGMSGFLIT